jgi:hypothetical protein
VNRSRRRPRPRLGVGCVSPENVTRTTIGWDFSSVSTRCSVNMANRAIPPSIDDEDDEDDDDYDIRQRPPPGS